MAVKDKIGEGLLFRLIVGIFVPILLAFALMGCILFLNIDIGKFHFASIRGIWANSLNELGMASLKESANSLNQLGADIIKQKTEDVAKQLEIYLKSIGYPKKVSMKQLWDDPIMKELSVQKVGETGYTAVFDNKNKLHFHANAKLTRGFDTKALYPTLGAGFIKINDTALAGTDNGGYYKWQEPDKSFRDKYMYIAHVKGTDLLVTATTYIDEFSRPTRKISTTMNNLQKSYSEQYNKRFGIMTIIIAIVLIILLVVIYLYSYSVVRPIRHLSEVADKISMGDMNATVDIKAKGEIGLLAESIERMQTSVKAAIERLQKRR
jgi:HAMP domain-containing protein